MREFWSVNGRSVLRLYINQLAMSVFGLMVITGSAAMGGAEDNLFILLASFVSMGLYLYIIYSMMWDAGAKAAAKTLRAEDSGVKKTETPFYIVLFGSTINIILYGLYAAAKITAAEVAGGMVEIIIRMTNAVYMGFEAVLFPNPNYELYIKGEQTVNTVMNTPPYYFFLTLIPLFIVGIGAYYLGASEISIMRKLGFKHKHKPTYKTGRK